jgi:hypothetical protein
MPMDRKPFWWRLGELSGKMSDSTQASQPLPGILDFGDAGVGVLPEVEEFLIMLSGLCFLPLLLGDLPQHIMSPGVDIAVK